VPAEPDRTRPDACPGAIAVHQAADGGLARIRVPGGTLTNAQLRALTDASAELGDGTLELTSRANIQIRALAAGAEVELASRLWAAGLLPSLSHERVRNIIASPLGDDQHLVDALDKALCAQPELAQLPGRFLVTVDDGRGDVSGLGGDIGLHRDALLLAGEDTGLRTANPVETVLEAALEFQRIRGQAWRLAEVPDGTSRITAKLGTPGPDRIEIKPEPTHPIGRFGDVTVAAVPLGRLTRTQALQLCDLAPWVRLTPWRSVVIPAVVTETDLVTDPGSPWHGVTACTGRPGCAKALADVRADATAWIKTRNDRIPVHWSGCDRRCGKPAGRVVEMIATGDGYRRSE
jgi:precorrin-3B synthase